MFPITLDDIERLKDSDLDCLAELDSKGLLVAPGEPMEAFKERLSVMSATFNEFEKDLKEHKEMELFDFITVQHKLRIPEEIMKEAAEIDDSYYRFSIDWVPGFFLSQSLSFLWGGCAISAPENLLSIFLIRNSFKDKRKWYVYYRDELLSHELSHIARMPLNDLRFEEYFAYQMSPSWLRRNFGSCFQSPWDALLFLAPVFLLLFARIVQTFFGVDYPIWPFFALAGVYPLFLICRSLSIKKAVQKATDNLVAAGVADPRPILFRCVTPEILFLGKSNAAEIKKFIDKMVFNELRWKVIKYRFLAERK